MKSSELLWDHLDREGLCPDAGTLEEWMDVPWIRVRLGQKMVPVYPTWGIRNQLAAHDFHHVLTGYDTSLRGEAELAAWEVASGGCGWSPFFWVDRLLLLVAAPLLIPRAMFRAFRNGLRCRNLYGRTREELLASDFEALERFVFRGRAREE